MELSQSLAMKCDSVTSNKGGGQTEVDKIRLCPCSKISFARLRSRVPGRSLSSESESKAEPAEPTSISD